MRRFYFIVRLHRQNLASLKIRVPSPSFTLQETREDSLPSLLSCHCPAVGYAVSYLIAPLARSLHPFSQDPSHIPLKLERGDWVEDDSEGGNQEYAEGT